MVDSVGDWDVLLMSVADGEASLADEQRVMDAVRQDTRLAQQLDGFRRTGRSLGELFEGVLAAPVPERLVHAVMETAAGPQQTFVRASAKAGFWAPWLAWLGDWQLPVAALAAVAIGFAAGAAVMAPGISSVGSGIAAATADPMAPSSAVTEALTVASTGSEKPVTTKGGVLSFRVVETFLDQSGAPCREFEAQAAAGPRQFGIACRTGNAWHLKAVFEGAAKAAGTTQTAGPGASGEMLDSMVEAMRQGDAVTTDAERKLIESGWAAAH